MFILMNQPARRAVGVVVILVCVAAVTGAECPGPEEVASRAEAFLARKRVESFGQGLSLSDAYCAQERYVAVIAKKLGAPVGVKAAFTAQAMRDRFGVTEPARGWLLAPMLADGDELPADFGFRGMVEADLAVTVKDEGINGVTTPLEALRHLDQLVPFIELPDQVLAEGQPRDAGAIIAVNVFSRSGVTGKGIPVQPTQAFLEAFAAMEAIFVDDTGKELSRAKGDTLLGNPANVVVWLAKNLAAHGQRLKAGDLLSLGAMGALVSAESGRTYTLRYEGLPGGPLSTRVRVR